MSTVKFKPLLAASIDADNGESLDTLVYPGYVTDKEDGIRNCQISCVSTSRSLKPIPNRFIQRELGRPMFDGLDGELTVGDTFNASTSGIMSADGEPDFVFSVFDKFDAPGGYLDRMEQLKLLAPVLAKSRVRLLLPVRVNDRAELEAYTAGAIARGKEGAMFRSGSGRYKQGRATFKEGILTKIKPFEDSEATVVGFEERMHNGNTATTNALGRTERSSHKENLVPMGTLGALVCSNQAKWPGVTFNVGTGFDDATRAYIWANRDKAIGTTAKFKYQAIGTVDKPRIPVFLGFRSAEDMS